MNNERKSLVITFTIIIVLSGLITLGIALTMTMFAVFAAMIMETKQRMSGDMEPEDIMWRNDIF